MSFTYEILMTSWQERIVKPPAIVPVPPTKNIIFFAFLPVITYGVIGPGTLENTKECLSDTLSASYLIAKEGKINLIIFMK